jgi:chromosome partitioning protein
MKIVVITSQKGGSGKTTLAAHLAVAAEHAKNGPAVLIDTDPQQTLATWWNAREAESPKLAPVSLREFPEKIEALAQAVSPTALSTHRPPSPNRTGKSSSAPIWC